MDLNRIISAWKEIARVSAQELCRFSFKSRTAYLFIRIPPFFDTDT